MLILKITINSWINASRDKRELSVLRELGLDAAVMAKGEKGDKFKKENIDGFKVFRFSTRPLSNLKFLNPLNRFFSLFIWSFEARKFNADIISCHDLTALLIGWLSNVGRKKKAKLVYDSHEFELGRNTKRNAITTFLIKNLERFLIKRSVFSIMVNESIAKEVQNIYKLDTPPVVVRNIPPRWEIDKKVCEGIRRQYLEKLGVTNDHFIGMYHGGIVPNRGIEEFIMALSKTEKTVGVILGNGTINYIEKLKELTKSYKVQNRFLFLPAVPINELWKYVGAADFEVAIPKIVSKNQYYSLPNKFFESIQSLTPIICNNTPEMANIIQQYEIGITIDPPCDVDKISEAINKMRTEKDSYQRYKENLVKAKNDLCWEKEKQILINAYKNIISTRCAFR
jgi:glycosyltransferase involved in cell wall biosynthesis